MASRRRTQCGFRPKSPAIVLGPSPSSSRSEATTRASSMTESVRGGALTTSSSRLASRGSSAPSTTTGTTRAPCPRQRSSRLKPSRTSSSRGAAPCTDTTRSGSSSSSPARARPIRPWRSAAKLVRRRSTSTHCTWHALGAPSGRSPSATRPARSAFTSSSFRRVRYRRGWSRSPGRPPPRRLVSSCRKLRSGGVGGRGSTWWKPSGAPAWKGAYATSCSSRSRARARCTC